MNNQHVILNDSFTKKGKSFWQKLLPKAVKGKAKVKETTTSEKTTVKYGDVLKNAFKGADGDLILAWRYNECIKTQDELKDKQTQGVHLREDFKRADFEYQFDITHEMTSTVSGLNVNIDIDKYFSVIDEETVSLNDLWTSICTQYQEKLESADDHTFFRYFIPDFLNFELFEEVKDVESEITLKNVVKFLRNLRTLVRTMN
mmetsp:Transcript_34371/g.39730  ORF Transcript_34371/g.39730 Transcript_34371/m.39730 type:complete len:202 (+) Transcript_34371:227-832(+)